MTYVYFIACPAANAIKIGSSFQPSKRLRTLQAANPTPLEMLLIVDGGQRDEENLHERFADEWIRGEWFRSGGVLSEFIASLLTMSEPCQRAAMKTPFDRGTRVDAFAMHTGRGNSSDRMEPRR